MAQVSSYDVANRSGAQVRADINDIYSAIKTCNSGPNNPASPEQFMLFGDNTVGDLNLKIYDGSQFRVIGKITEDNLGLLPRTGGMMTGQILGNDTSLAGSPAYSFDQDPDTGMYRTAANKIGFSTQGGERAIIDNFGLSIENRGHIAFRESSSNGASGVTLKAPTSLSGDVNLTLPDTITNGGFLQTDGSGQLTFQIVNGVPTGAIFALPDTQATGTGYQSNGIPTGYLECNGASLLRSAYAALFNVIGTRYGAGTSNNNTTFSLPDLRGEFIRGWANDTTDSSRDQGRGIGSDQGSQNDSHNHPVNITTSNKSLTGTIRKISETFNSGGGTAGGVFTKTSGLNAANTPSRVDSSPAAGVDLDVSHDHSVNGNTGFQGGNESRPRNVAMMYIIKI